jgi:hypothetical protein
MSCWVCQGDTKYTDDYDLDWCNAHLVIWKEAWDATADDPSF